MEIFKTKKELAAFLKSRKATSIGFVPTMGALHAGHLSLIKQAKAENDLVVASIFVNPIQFNNASDLKKYPRTLESDAKMLEKAGCDVVFAPSEKEMYPKKPTETYDFGKLEKVMEGKFRPGHFNGVAIVVKRLFEIVQPQKAYFGEKDFQQLAIIRELVKKEKMKIDIVACPIIREKDGLAMSSRNARLDKAQRSIAPIIHKTIRDAADLAGLMPVKNIEVWVKKVLSRADHIQIEYVTIANEKTLQAVKTGDTPGEKRIFIACFLGDVRLIDNVKIQ